MSEDQLKAFMVAVKADADLQERLNAAGDADAVVAIAKAAGFVISVEELEAASQAVELSDEELESAAGGGFTGATCINASCKFACTSTQADWCKQP